MGASEPVEPTESGAALSSPPDFLVERTGGPTAAREFRGRPFNQSARSLSNVEFRRFGAGALVFDKHFAEADGLGPTFNATSCLSCHLDGDEPDVAEPGEVGPGLLIRLSVPGVADNGGPLGEPTYGLQLQDRAVSGAAPEGAIEVDWEASSMRYPDGTVVELRRPRFSISALLAGSLHPDTLVSPRITPTMTGMGLLEAIPEADLVAAADPEDADGDGISGRVNRVWDVSQNALRLGRFGWKAGQPTVLQQSAAALHDDLGITTSLFPDFCFNQGSACRAMSGTNATAGGASGVEMSDADFADQLFYNRTLAVPVARNVGDPAVVRGANTFVEVGCSSCHTPIQRSGDDEVAGLSNVTFHPYTDLLLHDMGPALADGRPEFEATGSEWRTPPLWTIGRRSEVTTYHNYLHDGRARTLEEAILWHGGEAEGSRDRFMGLSKARRVDLLAFLASL